VRLLITPIVADAQQFRLFESPLRDPNRFGETLGRLHALLGEGRVGVVQLEDTHQPDRFQLVTPKFARLNERPEAATQEESRMLGLPLRRFRPPRPAQVRFTRGVPTRFSSAQGQGEITDAAGPYRASGNWWDQATWSIEEWDIELNDGALYRLSKHGDSWFVEGCYQTAIPLPA
jgi:protein ImuB